MRIPPLPLAEAGTWFRDPGGMQGLVDIRYVKANQLKIVPATCQLQVQRPTAAAQHNMLFSLFSCEREGVCFNRHWFVCLSVTVITKKIVDGFVRNFMGRFLEGK